MDWKKESQRYKKNQLQLYSIQYGQIPKVDTFYFYYDESDNIRKFNFKKANGGFNNYILSQFTLGGIVSKTPLEDDDFKELYESLNLQKTIKEIKYTHIRNNNKKGISSFDSEKLFIFLNFLFESEFYIHYTTVNVFYYGVVVDIVDSIIPNNHIVDKNTVDSLKSYLYLCMLSEIDNWEKILYDTNFPNLTSENQPKFICHLYNAVWKFYHSDYHEEQQLILDYLAKLKTNNRLIFLTTNENNTLIKDFKTFYLHKIFIYDHSFHTFDEEDYIEKIFSDIKIDTSIVAKRYQFVESHQLKALQISDVCMAMISTLYKFFAQNSLDEVKDYFKKVDPLSYEYKNLQLLAKIINKTIQYDPCFINQMSNPIELEKYNYFLNS